MMSEYKKYDEYKDSGIEWIGEVPKHWEITKIKRLFHTKKVKSLKKHPTVLSLTLNGIKIRDISTNEGQLASSYQGYHKVQPGDIVLNPMDLISGYVDCSKFHGVISPAYTILEENYDSELDENYYNKYFQYHYFNKIFFAFGSGVSFEHRWTLNDKNLKKIDVIYPPKQEQQKAASFLDQKITKIDKIINKKESLIKDLKKYKKSVITEAVTKGKLGDNYIDESGELVDEIEMTDSGVKWIGEVPKYFHETKLKYNIKTTKGYAFKASLFKDAGIPIIKATHIKNKTIIETNDYISPEHLKEYKSVKLYKDDIIMSTVGSNPDVLESAVGQLAMVPEKYDGALLNQNTVIFRIPKNQDISKKFLFYYLTSNKFRKFLDLYAHGTANQSSLTLREVLNFPLALPKKEIQEFIIDLIDNKILYINKLITKTKESIQKYKEYKKSLIFEAVTGKIDLRDYELEGGEELAEHKNTSTADRERISTFN